MIANGPMTDGAITNYKMKQIIEQINNLNEQLGEDLKALHNPPYYNMLDRDPYGVIEDEINQEASQN
jgi:hypothetical protein